MNFKKMHGLGNDFVIVDHREGQKAPTPELVRAISDRHLGIGCDQYIVLEPSEKAGVFMRIYNPDGSQAESCGNATRCVAHNFMMERSYLESKEVDTCTVETVAGVLNCRRVGDDTVEVDMGPPKEIKDLDIGQGPVQNPVFVNMGNPHCVFFVDNPEDIDVETLGPVFENHEVFPHRANISFAGITGDNSIRVRVWERGAGITLACGSAACAVIAAAVHRGLSTPKAEIVMDGGVLILEQRESDGHILKTGPVAYPFYGIF